MKSNIRTLCSYNVEISKQFLTLASAGVAFVVGLAISNSQIINGLFYITVTCLVLSILLGLVFIMSVVAHISSEENYDVYSKQLRTLAMVQMVGFFFGIILLGYFFINSIRESPSTSISNPTVLEKRAPEM
ncbi:hypothetical protein GWO43_12305 [candidate division KSB1 bacterium]|nr:hypothetical protein [candidate division KSB1 bacterium]NIR70999.1 hypothetical protein [candidate division KSB1 bacterium]NIS24740.1 hypothetical protein [candidate division KSB1 bacterium]NIT71644.1 hypothetical protein [candidate division KSB1 bacterium]NIU25351.1 hypothetical protein [candidate division KSB1 bacterium]